MALAYADIGAANDDTAFVNRVGGGLVAQCITVNGEAANTANHVQRLQLLGRVLNNLDHYALVFAPLIAAVNPIVGLANVDAATDPQILTGIQNVWDGVALQGI